MSSGHFHSTFNPDRMLIALRNAMSSSRIRARLDEKYSVDRTYDIPYLSGCSNNGKVIYLDRHLPTVLKFGPKVSALAPYLILHERMEKALIDLMDMEYEEAHKIASYVERKELEENRIDPYHFELALDPYIKADKLNKIERTPWNLNLKPYYDSRDIRLIARIKGKM